MAMIEIILVGTIVMDCGILLLTLDRWTGTRRPTPRWLSPASMGQIGPMLDHIAAVESRMASLDSAIGLVLPDRPETDHERDAPTCDDVADAYTCAGARLVALCSAHLRRPPSAALNRYTELCRHIGHDLGDDGRAALLRDLDAAGEALRADGRRLGPPSGQTAADLDEVNRELRRAVVARLDDLRPLLVKGRRGSALSKRERATLVEQLASVASQLAAADALARTAPLASLRALAALHLPAPTDRPLDVAFVTGCRAVEAGLRVCAARGDAGLSMQIGQCAAAIDTQLDRLHAAVASHTDRAIAYQSS
jgi:hypothetical protein